jgi:NifB/MoaA-like Fe-S oxidoreductase
VSAIQKELRGRLGTTFAFLGDEIYVKAGRAVPSRKHYGDYPQIEDGIGMVRSFRNDFASLWRRLDRRGLARRDAAKLDGTVMTGTLFASAFSELVERTNQRFGTRLNVVGVENNYFGGDVSVAGLLTGGDFLKARDRIRGSFAIIPASAIKSDEDILLDGMKLSELRSGLSLPVMPMDFKSFAQMLETANPIS